ncbi:hypothetical protein [Acetobacter sp. DmW_125127]|uniref:hypothetical protein n=1 Tax=Acetobacter sp. DmW_125127 TaxID=2591088 RepID=UPI001EE7D930|nr:hypothetical protein [Acetobacter sp. DmW_125127]
MMDNSHASIDTKKATQRTVELFLKAFGNAPASIVGGAKAGAFRDLLFALPASLGKRKSSLTLEEEAQRAREEGLPTLSGKKPHDASLCPVEPATPARTGHTQSVDRLEF